MKRFILWEYPRASWQYDLIVAVILLFIFAIPRAWFRDQPRASSIAVVAGDNGSSAFWIEPELLSGAPASARTAQAAALVKARFGQRQNVVRIEPIFDSEHEVKGYMAFTTP